METLIVCGFKHALLSLHINSLQMATIEKSLAQHDFLFRLEKRIDLGNQSCFWLDVNFTEFHSNFLYQNFTPRMFPVLDAWLSPDFVCWSTLSLFGLTEFNHNWTTLSITWSVLAAYLFWG